jgi:hypothetical protein
MSTEHGSRKVIRVDIFYLFMSKNKNWLDIAVSVVAIGANLVTTVAVKGGSELVKSVNDLSHAMMETISDKQKGEKKD